MSDPLYPALRPNMILYIDPFSETTVELKIYDITSKVLHLYPTAPVKDKPTKPEPVSSPVPESGAGSPGFEKKLKEIEAEVDWKGSDDDDDDGMYDGDSFAEPSDDETLLESPTKSWSWKKRGSKHADQDLDSLPAKLKEDHMKEKADKKKGCRDKGKERKSIFPETNQQRKARKKSKHRLDFTEYDRAVGVVRANLGDPIYVIRRRHKWWAFYSSLADVTAGPGLAAFDPTAELEGSVLCQYRRAYHSSGEATIEFAGKRASEPVVTSKAIPRCKLYECPNQRSLARRLFRDFSPESYSHNGSVYGWRMESGSTHRYFLMKRHLNFRPDVTILPPKSKESKWWQRSSKQPKDGADFPISSQHDSQEGDEKAGQQSRVLLEHDSQCSVAVGRFRWYTSSKTSEFANRTPGSTFAIDTTGNIVKSVEEGGVVIDPLVATIGCVNAVFKALLRQTERRSSNGGGG